MKLLHIVHQYLPENVGGTELYAHWLAHGQAQQGHQVSIFHRRFAEGTGLVSRIEADNVRVWSAWSGPMSPTKRLLATFKESQILDAFAQVLDAEKPELIHIQHLLGLPIQLVDLLRQRQIPFVITLHDYWWVCANAQLITNYNQQLCDGPNAYLNCARCALARSGQSRLWPATPAVAAPLAWRNHLLRKVLYAAQKLITPSKFVRDWYADYGVAPDKLIVIPHGLDSPPTIEPKNNDSRPTLRFAYVGGLSWQKGVHILLEAFEGVDAELWIAGDESANLEYVANLRQMASAKVQFLGTLTRDQVWDRLKQVDVVVVPSLWYEAFSFIVSEAFAVGVPVVASNLGTLADRVQHQVDGLLVPPNDSQALHTALLQFIDEPDLLPRLRKGIKPVLTFGKHLEMVEALYRSVLEGK